MRAKLLVCCICFSRHSFRFRKTTERSKPKKMNSSIALYLLHAKSCCVAASFVCECVAKWQKTSTEIINYSLHTACTNNYQIRISSESGRFRYSFFFITDFLFDFTSHNCTIHSLLVAIIVIIST